MDANLKAKWVEALRSGEYKQIPMELHDREGGYCCLGVLCTVAQIDMDDTGPAYRVLERITGGYAPLVTLNDDKGKSFAEIADWIEANL
ncbi:hypothetical protein JEY40_24825 [Bradyrhizobium japonicum]|uniref:hypothetical protein n=1 Tax=Bradyrhizobium japonicum TaxID=375 RepID=UPI00200D4B37|nr:hypothetical protein [Bradyrhizobium japonicum]UQD69243.1 hypothetical protein JEY40_24825 [Bradyrhizobium japonicum]WAX24506.1 hypothetical protein [Bradyrhizobium phage ppBjS10J-1]